MKDGAETDETIRHYDNTIFEYSTMTLDDFDRWTIVYTTAVH